MTPFFVLYGREAASFTEIQIGQTPILEAEEELLRRQGIVELVKIHLDKAQARMKIEADKHKSHIEFQIGEWVFVKVKPYRQLSVVHRLHNKLSTRYYEPF